VALGQMRRLMALLEMGDFRLGDSGDELLDFSVIGLDRSRTAV